jgi:hypothetical protein
MIKIEKKVIQKASKPFCNVSASWLLPSFRHISICALAGIAVVSNASKAIMKTNGNHSDFLMVAFSACHAPVACVMFSLNAHLSSQWALLSCLMISCYDK